MIGQKSGQKNEKTIGQKYRKRNWTTKSDQKIGQRKKTPAKRKLTKNRRTTSDRKIGQTSGGQKNKRKFESLFDHYDCSP